LSICQQLQQQHDNKWLIFRETPLVNAGCVQVGLGHAKKLVFFTLMMMLLYTPSFFKCTLNCAKYFLSKNFETIQNFIFSKQIPIAMLPGRRFESQKITSKIGFGHLLDLEYP
jgi:hypothetical protein